MKNLTISLALLNLGFLACIPYETGASKNVEVLAVQTAASGTHAPMGDGGAFVLILQQVHPRVVVFSNRPERLSTTMSIDQVIDLFWNSDEVSPDAALEVIVGGKQRVVSLELSAPQYDADTGTITYQAQPLPELSNEFQHLKNSFTIDVPPTFADPTLFIDFSAYQIQD